MSTVGSIQRVESPRELLLLNSSCLKRGLTHLHSWWRNLQYLQAFPLIIICRFSYSSIHNVPFYAFTFILFRVHEKQNTQTSWMHFRAVTVVSSLVSFMKLALKCHSFYFCLQWNGWKVKEGDQKKFKIPERWKTISHFRKAQRCKRMKN